MNAACGAKTALKMKQKRAAINVKRRLLVVWFVAASTVATVGWLYFLAWLAWRAIGPMFA